MSSSSDQRPQRDGQPNAEDLNPVEARQAVTTGHARWVLLISLLLAVIVLGGAFLWYSSVQQGTPVVHGVPSTLDVPSTAKG